MSARPPRVLAALLAALLSGAAGAQEAPKLVLPRPSPSATLKQTVGLTDITVAYSSPAVKGRKIWGEVVPFGELWRAGANECTKVTFSTAATVGGRPLAAGSYCLFLLPAKTGFTLVLNKDTGLWGTAGYKEENDVLRVLAQTSAIPHRERLAFEVLDFDDDGGTLALEWEALRVGVRFQLATREAVLSAIRALRSDEWRPYASAARYLLEHKLEPALASEMVERSLRLKTDWYNLWIKAQILAAAGQKKDAVAVARQAEELGKKSPNFPAADEVAKAIVDWQR